MHLAKKASAANPRGLSDSHVNPAIYAYRGGSGNRQVWLDSRG